MIPVVSQDPVVHPLLLSRISSRFLMQMHVRVHDFCIKCAEFWQAAADLGHADAQWGPKHCLLYHDLIVDEMRLRGIPHHSELKGDVWFDRLLRKHEEQDLLCDSIPMGYIEFVTTAVYIYMEDAPPTRESRHPTEIIDLFDWTGRNEAREAAIKMLTRKWLEFGVVRGD